MGILFESLTLSLNTRIKNTWFTTPTRASLRQRKLLHVTCTKVAIFSVTDDAFPVSLYCMKTYSKKILIDNEILFNYCLSGKRRITENVFEIWIDGFRLLANRATLTPDKASVVIMARLALRRNSIGRIKSCKANFFERIFSYQIFFGFQ